MVLPNEIKSGLKRTEIISSLESKKGIIISYNILKFNDEIITDLPQSPLALEIFITKIFKDYTIDLERISDKKYVLNIKEARIFLSGYIYDKETLEPIASAVVYDPKKGTGTYSDESGFYYIEARPGNVVLIISMIGYEDTNFAEIRQNSGMINHYLDDLNLQLPGVIKEGRQLVDPLTEILSKSENISKNTMLGETDPINQLKRNPGVMPGAEGNNGINIRGGSSDQNLILLEGMPIYESNHTGNLSSIFVDEAIRNIDFMKSGLPARYGGRLSSVINIQLKDGNKKQRETFINTGLQGITFFTEGPVINNKLSYAFSLRNSWINSLLKPFKKLIPLYEDISMNYRDLQMKMTYQISNNQKISLAGYFGGDNLKLAKSNKDNDLITSETNKLGSSNDLLSVNYTNIFNSKIKFHLNAGYLKYKVSSIGQYSFVSGNNDSIINELQVINFSTIEDRQLMTSLDYYFKENIKVKIGLGYINHENNPAVKQSRFISEGSIDSLENLDDPIVSDEYFTYIESNLQLYKDLIITPGFFLVNYNSVGKKYSSFQPRVQAILNLSKNLTISGGYTKSSQFIHLLANSGLGLPSELWVPSNQILPPQNLKHYNIGLKWEIDSSTQISLATYIKDYDGLIEYIEPVDLFLNIISPDGNPPILNNPRDWQDKTEKGGIGRAEGFEFSISRNTVGYQTWLSFHYGRSNRKFEKINEGNTFITKYDKPYNFNTGMSFKLSKNWQAGLMWVYSSGQPFTIADEGFNPLGGEILPEVKFLNPSSKNNYRMPAFHQLTINADYKFSFNNIRSNFSIGLYNVYNRLNPFYIYSTRTIKNNIVFKKVSLFPILPQLNFEMRF